MTATLELRPKHEVCLLLNALVAIQGAKPDVISHTSHQMTKLLVWILGGKSKFYEKLVADGKANFIGDADSLAETCALVIKEFNRLEDFSQRFENEAAEFDIEKFNELAHDDIERSMLNGTEITEP